MENSNHNLKEYVTAMIGGQLFGLPILRVQDVFAPERVTRVPLAPPEIAGVLNLRGRIVTLIDLSRRLGLDQGGQRGPVMAIVDSIGEVLKLDEDAREANPLNLDPALARVSTGIHRTDNC
jgi:purine-binding chemotaxis protein CheW